MSTGLKMKYFVLSPFSKSDPVHADASKKAIELYANIMEEEGFKDYAQDLRDWVNVNG